MKKCRIFWIIFFVKITTSWSQDFYDINNIQDIKITFSQNNWDYILDTATVGKESYLMAQTVVINGVSFDSVGVRYKGNSTYNANQVKNPFHIELDTWKKQDYQGYTDIKLSNAAKDPSMIREVLSYNILRQYMHAPLSNYANVYVNGKLIGLYVSSESVSKKFVDKHFYSKNNPFFKCNPISGAGPGGGAKPNLVFLGNDSTLYYQAYEKNSEYGWKELLALCDTLKNKTSSIEKVLDLDRALWMLAFDNVLVNLDSYIGGFAQNYYLYQDDNHRFNPVIWDLNESFGTFSSTGTTQLPNTSAKQQMTHLLHQNDAAWPLIQKLMAVPTYKRMYVAHMRTILAENFANNSYKTSGEILQTIINNAVNSDPNKFFTYTQFKSNLTTDVASGNTNAPGITNLMNGRNTFLNSQADFQATPPVIGNIVPSVTKPVFKTFVTLKATITNANKDKVYIGYRYSIKLPFTKIAMFDDGVHGDGAAGDNVYGASIFMDALTVQFYIYAENDNAGAFAPVRAEHEFYTLNAEIPTIAKGDLVINELMADNDTTILDPSSMKSDWIELYNNTDFEISLKNAYLSDSYSKPLKWRFPDNATVASHDYLIVWASDTTQAGLNANFKLSSTGERVILSYENGFVTDSISFGALKKDESFSRCPNGTGAFELTKPTFNAENCKTTSDENISFNDSISFFPNPTENFVYLNYNSEKLPIKSINIVDNNGRLIYINVVVEINKGIDVSRLTKGLYFIEFKDSENKTISIRKLLKL